MAIIGVFWKFIKQKVVKKSFEYKDALKNCEYSLFYSVIPLKFFSKNSGKFYLKWPKLSFNFVVLIDISNFKIFFYLKNFF